MIEHLIETVDEIEVGVGGEEESWTWVENPAHDIVGFKRIGWRVLSVGGSVEGAGESGVLQGL